MPGPGTTRSSDERTNEEWLGARRGAGPAADRAQLHLRSLLAGALRKATSRFSPDDATLEDLTQVALLRVLEKLDRFEGRSRFTTWAYSVAVHAAFAELRRSRGPRTTGEAAAAEVSDDQADPTAPVEQREIVDLLHRIISDQLTERQRAAVLGELRGTPRDQLAAELETNRNALHKLLHDARSKLRHGLEAAGIFDDDVRRAFDL